MKLAHNISVQGLSYIFNQCCVIYQIDKVCPQKGKVQKTGLICWAGEVNLSLGLAHVSQAENSLITFFIFLF